MSLLMSYLPPAAVYIVVQHGLRVCALYMGRTCLSLVVDKKV